MGVNYTNRQGQQLADIMNFGAKRTYATSWPDTILTKNDAAFASAIAAVSAGEFGGVRVPMGRFPVGSTIDFGQLRGYSFVGEGAVSTDGSNPNSSFPERSSTIIWDGASGGTVVKKQGSKWLMDAVTILGKPSGAATRAGKGVHLSYAAGVGSGESWIPSFAVIECDSGWYCGDNSTSFNAAGLTFGKFYGTDCDNLFHVVNNQGVEYTFLHFSSGPCTNCILFNAGGNLLVGHLQSGPFADTVLRLDAGPGGIGTNNGSFIIQDVRIDGGGAGTFTTRLYHQDGTGGPHVTFGNINYNAGVHDKSGRTLFQIDGGITDLTVKSMNGEVKLGNDLINISANSKAVFEHCLFWEPENWGSGSYVSGTGKVEFRDCYHTNGSTAHIALPDWRTDARNVQSGTSYTLAVTDPGKLLEFTNTSSGVTLTVPKDSVLEFPLGTEIEILQAGTAQVTVTPVDGEVTVNGRNGLKTAGQWAKITLTKRAANVWVVTGDAAV